MSSGHVAWLAVGAGLVLGSALAWCGLWRSWIRSPHYGYAVLVIFPGTGLAFIAYALTSVSPSLGLSLLMVTGGCGAVLGWGLWVWHPQWLGPRYWRELSPDPMSDRQTANLVAIAGPSPEKNSDNIARAAREPSRPLATRNVALVDPAFGRPTSSHVDGIAHGKLLLYPDEIVFAADPGDDALRPGPTIRTLAPATITAVRALEGPGRRNTIHLDTTDTTVVWEIRAARRQALLDDLYTHYGHRKIGKYR